MAYSEGYGKQGFLAPYLCPGQSDRRIRPFHEIWLTNPDRFLRGTVMFLLLIDNKKKAP